MYTPPLQERMFNILKEIDKNVKTTKPTVNDTQGILVLLKKTVGDNIDLVFFVQCDTQNTKYINTWKINKNKELGTTWSQELINFVEDVKIVAKEKFNINIYAIITSDYQHVIEEYQDDLWVLNCYIKSAINRKNSLVDNDLQNDVQYLLETFSQDNLKKGLMKNGGKLCEIKRESSCYHYDIIFNCINNLEIMTKMIVDKSYELD